MKKIAIFLMVLTVMSKVLGFLRDITLSFFYGASATSDAYIVSITITSVLFGLIFSGISTGYIPLFKQIECEMGEKTALRFTNNLVHVLLVISTILIMTGFVFADQLVRLFALGFDEKTMKTAVELTRIGLVGVYFTSLTQLLLSHLQLKERFTISAMVGFPFNIMIILSIFISSQTSVLFLAVGTVIAALSQFLFLLPSLYKTNYRYEPILNFKDKYMKKMAVVVYPLMIGMSIDHINVMVDKTLASRIVEGGISALTYASRLNDLVHGIFVLSFITVMFPYISQMAANKKIDDVKKSISEVMSSVILLVLPASVGIMVLAEPIIDLLFGRGDFDDQAIRMTSQALFFYAIGMIGYGIREVLLRTFYALQDMKTPMYNASIAVVLNIIMNFILSSFMGINGLALATSIAAVFSTGLLFSSLRKKIGSLGLKSKLIPLLKISLASGVMGVIVAILNSHVLIEWNELLKICVLVFIGSSVYFILITVLKVEETKIIQLFFKRKLRL